MPADVLHLRFGSRVEDLGTITAYNTNQLNAPSPYLHLTLSAVCWGGTFVSGRLLAPLIDPYSAAFLRFALASVLLLTWRYWRVGRFPALSVRQFGGIVLLGSTAIAAYNLLFFCGALESC